MCRRRHCGFGGGARWRLAVEGVRLVPPVDGIQRIMDGDVHHGKNPRFMERVHTPELVVQATSEAARGGRLVPVVLTAVTQDADEQ